MTTPSILSAIQKLRSLLTRQEKLKWLGIVAFALCSSLFEVLTASIIIIFAQILNDPTVGKGYLTRFGFSNEISSGRTVFYISIAVGIIYLIKNSIAAIEVFFQNFSIQKMNYNFKNKLLHKYANIDYGFYLTRNSSYGLQVISNDSEHIFSNSMLSLANILSEGSIFICLAAMIIYMNPILALIISIIGIIISIFISKILLPQFYYLGQKLQQASLYSHQHLLQFFHGFKEIILMGKRTPFINTYTQYAKQKNRVVAFYTATNSMPRIAIECMFVGLFILTICYLCIGHKSPSQMLGLLAGYLYAGFRLMPGLNRIITQLNIFKSNIPSIDRVHKEYNNIAIAEHYTNVPKFHFNDSITIKNINFKYLNTQKDTLSNINLTIRKGNFIGIIGKTGSGKSTLVDLILGLLKPHKGNILIDKKFPVNCSQWHKKIGYVPQNIYLTDDTIAANIAFGEKNIDIKSLNHAIDTSQLREFIESLPNKTKTIVGERGIRLSGGERQRIAIARAIYRNPEILIFDEATSSLDNETESKLMKTINSISQNHTVIMIAHRLTTLKNCNSIVMLRDGKLDKITCYEELYNPLTTTKITQYA